MRGDFNARIGKKGGGMVVGEEKEEGGERGKRQSKDRKINGEKRKMVDFLEEKGWRIFNGNVRGDEEGEYTFTGGRGNTVIDYVLGGEEVKERVKRMRIGDRIETDHHPLEVWIRGGESKRKEKEKKYRSSRGVWDEESCRMFRSKLGRMELGKKEIGEEWEKMESKVKEAIRGTEGVPREGTEKKGEWWDKECIEKKKEVRKELRGCRMRGNTRE